ncbi:hypothetical protein WA158_004118 [Blastocystis sp. Blastoise]
MNQEAKKYYNLNTSGIRFEREMSQTKMCDYFINEGDTYYICNTCSMSPNLGHDYHEVLCENKESYCHCGLFNIKYDGYCENHKIIHDHFFSSEMMDAISLQWYETYCHFCIYALFYYTKISNDKYRFLKAISIINSLILLCESDLSIYTYICTFFSSSIEKHNSLFNKKIVDIDRSFLTLITIKDQAPFTLLLLINCFICEDKTYQDIYQMNLTESFYLNQSYGFSILSSYFDFYDFDQFKNSSLFSIIHIAALPDLYTYINDTTNYTPQQQYFRLIQYIINKVVHVAVKNACIYIIFNYTSILSGDTDNRNKLLYTTLIECGEYYSLCDTLRNLFYSIYNDIKAFIHKSTKEESITLLTNVITIYNKILLRDIRKCYNLNQNNEYNIVHIFIVILSMILSEIYNCFGVCKLPLEIHSTLFFIYHISLSQFLYIFHLISLNDDNDDKNNYLDLFASSIQYHFLSIAEYYGILLQILPLFINEYDSMTLFLWYIYKGYNYLEKKEIYKDINMLYNDIQDSYELFSVVDIHNYINEICPFVTLYDVIRLLLCIQYDPCYTLDNYFISKNKLSSLFLNKHSPNKDISLIVKRKSNASIDIPSVPDNYLNNNPDLIYIPSSCSKLKTYIDSPFYLTYITYYIQNIISNENEESIRIMELLYLLYFYIKNSPIDPIELSKNIIINDFLKHNISEGITIYIQHLSAVIQLLIQTHKSFNKLIEEYDTTNAQNDYIKSDLIKPSFNTDNIICAACMKRGGLFVLPVYISNQCQQFNDNHSEYSSSYSIYKNFYHCIHKNLFHRWFDFNVHSCNHPIHYTCFSNMNSSEPYFLEKAIPCCKCGQLYTFVIPILDTSMFYHNVTKEEEEAIYDKYKSIYNNNPKDIDISFYVAILSFSGIYLPRNSRLYKSMICDLFPESILSSEYFSRFSLLTMNQQNQLLYTRNFILVLLRILLHSGYVTSHCLSNSTFPHFHAYFTQTLFTINGLCQNDTELMDSYFCQHPIQQLNKSIEYTFDIHLRLIEDLLKFYYLWNDKTLYNREKEKENIQRDREILYVDENEVAFQYINIPIDDYYEEEYQQYIQDMKNSKDIYSEYIKKLIGNIPFPMFNEDNKHSIFNNDQYGYIFERYRFRYINILHCRNTILQPSINNKIRTPYDDFNNIFVPQLEIYTSEIDQYKLDHDIKDIDIQSKLKDVEYVFIETSQHTAFYLDILQQMMEDLYLYYEDIMCNNKQSNIRYIYLLIANIFYNLADYNESHYPVEISATYPRLSSLYTKPIRYHEIIKYCYVMEDLLLFKPLLTQMTQNYMSIFSEESLLSIINNNSTSLSKQDSNSSNNKLLQCINISTIIKKDYSTSIDITSDDYYYFIYFYLIITIHIELSKFTVLNDPEYQYNPDYPVIWNQNKTMNIQKTNNTTNNIDENKNEEGKESNEVINENEMISNSSNSYNNFFNPLKILFLQLTPKVFSDAYINYYNTRKYPFVIQNDYSSFLNFQQNYILNQTSIYKSHYNLPLHYSTIEISSKSIVEYLQLFFELYDIDTIFVDYQYILIGLLASYSETGPSYIHQLNVCLMGIITCNTMVVNNSTFVNDINSFKSINQNIENYLKIKLESNHPYLSDHDINQLTHNSIIFKPRNIAKEFISYLFCHFPLGNNNEMTILLYKHFKELYPVMYKNNKLIILLQLMVLILHKDCLKYLFYYYQKALESDIFDFQRELDGNGNIDEDIFTFFSIVKEWERREIYVYEEIPYEEEITNMLLAKGITYTVQQLSVPFMRSLYLLNLILSPSFIPSSDISIPTSFSSLYTSISLSSSPSILSLLKKKPCDFITKEVIDVLNFDFYLSEKEMKDLSKNCVCNQCNKKNNQMMCMCVACGQTVCYSCQQNRQCIKQYLNDDTNFCHCCVFIQLYSGTIYYFGSEKCFDLTHSLLLEDIDIEKKNEKEMKELAIQEITSLLNRNDISQRKKYLNKMYDL